MTRNPLYLGSFIIACGIAVICASRRHWLATAIVWAAVLATFYWLYPEKIAIEEEDLRQRFGLQFEAYRSQVPRFWPAWDRWKEGAQTGEWAFRQVLKNKEQHTLWAILGLILFLRIEMVFGTGVVDYAVLMPLGLYFLYRMGWRSAR